MSCHPTSDLIQPPSLKTSHQVESIMTPGWLFLYCHQPLMQSLSLPDFTLDVQKTGPSFHYPSWQVKEPPICLGRPLLSHFSSPGDYVFSISFSGSSSPFGSEYPLEVPSQNPWHTIDCLSFSSSSSFFYSNMGRFCSPRSLTLPIHRPVPLS